MDKCYILMCDVGEQYEDSYTSVLAVFNNPPSNCQLRQYCNVNLTIAQMGEVRSAEGFWYSRGREYIRFWIENWEVL